MNNRTPGRAQAAAVTVDDIRTRDGCMTHRQASVGAVDVGARTVELAFSSEEPAQRWWGFEILSHDPSAVMLERIGDSAPLLLDHDWGGPTAAAVRRCASARARAPRKCCRTLPMASESTSRWATGSMTPNRLACAMAIRSGP